MSNQSMSRDERDHLRYLRDKHYRAQGGRCYFCDVQMTSADVPEPKPLTTLTIEHLKSRTIGGGSNYLNTAASCFGCNTKRSQQRAVGKRTVPPVRVVRKRVVTYAYTVPSDPSTLRLFNAGPSRDDMLQLRAREGEPITLKHMEEVD
jgi:hypothetical protein